jgi:hypothetical protein
MDRKQFLSRLAAVSTTAVVAPLWLASCGGSDEKSTSTAPKEAPAAPPKAAPAPKPEPAALGPDACQDYSSLSEVDIQTRQNLQYVAQSEKENQNCANCGLYVKPEKAGGCGGCKLFKGPAHPQGWCMTWNQAVEG